MSIYDYEIVKIGNESISVCYEKELIEILKNIGAKRVKMPKKANKDLVCFSKTEEFPYLYSVKDEEVYEHFKNEGDQYNWFKLKNAFVHLEDFEKALKIEIEAMSRYNRVIMESYPSRNIILGNVELDKTINSKNGKYFTDSNSRFVHSFKPSEVENVLQNFNPNYEVKKYSYDGWYQLREKALRDQLQAKINELS
jgi:hypothetical protein